MINDKVKINLIDFMFNILNFKMKDNKLKMNKNLYKYCQANELKIQKILFFVFGLFYQKYHRELFKGYDFRAWKYGVVEINYHKWIKSNYDEFLNIFTIALNYNEICYLENLIRCLARLTPWELVELSHLTYAWINGRTKSDFKIKIEDLKMSFLPFAEQLNSH